MNHNSISIFIEQSELSEIMRPKIARLMAGELLSSSINLSDEIAVREHLSSLDYSGRVIGACASLAIQTARAMTQ